ncbi:MAG: helix-turn-helix transcriptional regulator [Chloroflexi bacterium]|nr:helix-turn-helix transcriptional regulator [Chloroflexota bacterium]
MALSKVNGTAIRIIRERTELSIADVVLALAAEGISVHPDHLRNIELGNKQPSEKLLGGIARALRCPKVALYAQTADVA